MKRFHKILSVAFLAAATVLGFNYHARAEIVFGQRNECSGSTDAALEFSRQGRFFATTDYADAGNDYGVLTRARNIVKSGVFPSYNSPWTSDGRRTLFGVEFDSPLNPKYPGQFGPATNIVPLFTRAVIQWKENVPAKGTWSACIRTPEGKLVKLNTDAGKTIYPFDRTTISFEPTAIKTFMIGLKGREDGLVNYADVIDIRLFIPPERSSLTNRMAVWDPGFYLAVFSPVIPGMIEGLTPVNSYCASHHTLYYHDLYTFDLFFRMTPFIEYKGTNIFAARKEYTVKVAKNGDDDMAEYTLTFDLPGEKPVNLEVKSVFRPKAEKSLEFSFRAPALPEGAKIGYQFYGPASVFSNLIGTLPVSSGRPYDVVTPAGKMSFQVRDGGDIAVAREPGAKIGWNLKDEKIKFATLAAGKDLTLAISLPIGSAGQPQPEVLNYTWRPSLAGEGEEGIAPFKASDLELLDEIDCGNPADPHPCFDVSNDPVIGTLRKRFGTLRERGGQQGPHGVYGYLAFLNNPQEEVVPVSTVAGKSCREIPDKLGVYFRYNLKTQIKPLNAYLVVIEHSFDQLRRGEFHSISLDKNDNLIGGSLLSGGIETSAASESAFRTESFLCYNLAKRWHEESVSSIVFSGVYSDGGSWERAPGPAVKSIRIYRIKTMPELPDLAALLPPVEKRRSFMCLTELCSSPGPMWPFQYPKLVGYDGIWTYNEPASQFFGGSSNMRKIWVHPVTLAANRQLFAAAEEQGLFVNLHLGQLLTLGFEGSDYDSFMGSFHGSYNGESVPFKPTPEELAHISSALKKSLGALSAYKSLKDISLADNTEPPCVWTERNLRDFCADTGAKLTPSPVYPENVQSILDGGPELTRQWMQWASAGRFKFHKWLLNEVRKYRPDLYLTLSRSWYRGIITCFESPDSLRIPGVTREWMAACGIKTFPDFLRFTGIDPDLYAGQPGFSLEIEANNRIKPKEKKLPEFYRTDWFRRVKDDFKAEGLSIMVNNCYEEHSKPLQSYTTIYACSKERFRKALVDAFLHGNAHNITLPTYTEPWRGRLDDAREFIVPYRLLPCAEPESFAGKITDAASQAVINKYGDRFGLVNAGGKETVVEIELPAGMATATDLSGGVPQKLETYTNKGGKPAVKIPMKPWSLKALEIK